MDGQTIRVVPAPGVRGLFAVAFLFPAALFLGAVTTDGGQRLGAEILTGAAAGYMLFGLLYASSVSWTLSPAGIRETSLFLRRELRWEEITEILISRGGDYHFSGWRRPPIEVARPVYLQEARPFHDALSAYAPDLPRRSLGMTLEGYFFVRHARTICLVSSLLLLLCLAWWRLWGVAGAGFGLGLLLWTGRRLGAQLSGGGGDRGAGGRAEGATPPVSRRARILRLLRLGGLAATAIVTGVLGNRFGAFAAATGLDAVFLSLGLPVLCVVSAGTADANPGRRAEAR